MTKRRANGGDDMNPQCPHYLKQRKASKGKEELNDCQRKEDSPSTVVNCLRKQGVMKVKPASTADQCHRNKHYKKRDIDFFGSVIHSVTS